MDKCSSENHGQHLCKLYGKGVAKDSPEASSFRWRTQANVCMGAAHENFLHSEGYRGYARRRGDRNRHS